MLKNTHAGAKDSRSHLPVPAKVPAERCQLLACHRHGDGAIAFIARESNCLSSHGCTDYRRHHTLDACCTRRRAHKVWVHQSHTLPQTTPSVQSAGIRTWISPCNCGASTCLPPVKHNSKRLSISCSLRLSRYLVHSSDGSVWPAILATWISPRSTWSCSQRVRTSRCRTFLRPGASQCREQHSSRCWHGRCCGDQSSLEASSQYPLPSTLLSRRHSTPPLHWRSRSRSARWPSSWWGEFRELRNRHSWTFRFFCIRRSPCPRLHPWWAAVPDTCTVARDADTTSHSESRFSASSSRIRKVQTSSGTPPCTRTGCQCGPLRWSYISPLSTEIAARRAEVACPPRRHPASFFLPRRCPCTPPYPSPSGSVQRVSVRPRHPHHAPSVGGVYPARGQDSTVGGGTANNCLGVVHMEEGVQVRVQVEVGREEQGEGETHRESQNEEATRNKRSTAHHGWHEYGVTRACRHLSQVVSMHISNACEVHEKNDVWGVSVFTPRRLQWTAIDCKRNQL